ncbi:MAG: tRNA (N6-threonylcarbamoyladenosine(37)-N6)-methyltransferase TrmO [Firmicutes bacterium]|nr:tRNA (N6-threonylcarbamoyladenosine(37)-N6)-methyltransferase TrmO [Bacillota bacterium]
MESSFEIRPIARIENDFPAKFGIPRQSGLANELVSRIVFEPEYRDENALRGIEGYSHLWLIWQFSSVPDGKWSPTVRPPRLGGNTRVGVFATRSPNRPNRLGLSSVGLLGVEDIKGCGKVILVTGADLMDGTPIFDIKPYLRFTDSHPDAVGGFADSVLEHRLFVSYLCDTALLSDDRRAALTELLSQDPRPSYQDDPERVYGFDFADLSVSFCVEGKKLSVLNIEKRKK